MMNTPSSRRKSQLGRIHIQAASIVKIKLMIHTKALKLKNILWAITLKFENLYETMTATAVGVVENKFRRCFGYIDIKLKIFFLQELEIN